MTLSKPKFPAPLRRILSRPADDGVAAPPPRVDDDAAPPARDPAVRGAPADGPEPSWRASSYDLKHGLDVVELPTSLPVDVLDRLFNAPPR